MVTNLLESAAHSAPVETGSDRARPRFPLLLLGLQCMLAPAGFAVAQESTAEAEASAKPSRTAAPESSLQLFGTLAAGMTYTTHQAVGARRAELSNSVLSSSLFGVRGREDLGGGLAALFRLESGFAIDTGAAGTSIAGRHRLWNRHAFVGLASGRVATLTVGRQFHAHADRVTQSLDVYNVAGTTLQTTPLGLFGVNRFVGNDTRVDSSAKVRLNGPAGSTLGLSAGLDDGAGRSVAFDLAQITPSYTLAVYGVTYRSPNLIAVTGARPEHQVVGAGAQVPLGNITLYLHYAHSSLDAISGNRPAQTNQLIAPGIRIDLEPVVLKAAYTHDSGRNLGDVPARDGKKLSWVQSAEYQFSRSSVAYLAVFNNRFVGGYRLDAVNLAVLHREATASSLTGYSVGLRHRF